MFKFKSLSAVASSLLIAGTQVVTMTPAHAVELEIDYTVDTFSFYCPAPVIHQDLVGNACFDGPDGDLFHPSDTYADGYRVAIHWRTGDGSRRGLCINKSGTADEKCDKDFAKGKVIEFRIGRCDGDVSPCTAVTDYSKYSAWATTKAG